MHEEVTAIYAQCIRAKRMNTTHRGGALWCISYCCVAKLTNESMIVVVYLCCSLSLSASHLVLTHNYHTHKHSVTTYNNLYT